MKPLSIKSVLVSLGLGLGAVALAYIFPIGLIIMPALLAFAGTVWGYGGLAIAAITAAGGIICLAGTVDSSIIGALVMFIPASIAMTYIFINKLPYRTAAVISAFCVAVGMYIMTCVPALMEGEGPFAYYLQYMAAFGDAVEKTAAQMGIDGDKAEMLRKMAAYLEYKAPDMAVMAMMCMGMGAGLANVVAARALCRAKGATLKPMAKFHLWQPCDDNRRHNHIRAEDNQFFRHSHGGGMRGGGAVCAHGRLPDGVHGKDEAPGHGVHGVFGGSYGAAFSLQPLRALYYRRCGQAFPHAQKLCGANAQISREKAFSLGGRYYGQKTADCVYTSVHSGDGGLWAADGMLCRKVGGSCAAGGMRGFLQHRHDSDGGL